MYKCMDITCTVHNNTDVVMYSTHTNDSKMYTPVEHFTLTMYYYLLVSSCRELIFVLCFVFILA